MKQQCPACDKFVRRCRDARLAKHKGVNRFARPGWTCVASRVTVAEFYADPGWAAFQRRKQSARPA